MSANSMASVTFRYRLAQIILLLSGMWYVLTGAALLFAPQWFFDNIGTFPPFNRHYAGDLGAFILALGLGLLFAVRQPHKQRLLIGCAAGASLLHAFNHVYDAVVDQAPLAHWLSDTLPLMVLGLLLVWVLAGVNSES